MRATSLKSFSVKTLRYFLIALFGLASISHVIFHAEFVSLIPAYLPGKNTINSVVAVLELTGALWLWIQPGKIVKVYLLTLLIVFIPSHIYFIQSGSCIQGGLCVREWIGWTRLLIGQPLLMVSVWLVNRNI